jgi:hypothetical protein
LEPLKSSSPPALLSENRGKCFKGSVPLGDGFFLEPNEVERLVAASRKYEAVLFQYLNGEELNFSPTFSPGRWVIYFRDWSLEECGKFPRCLEILRERVKPERDKIVPTNNMARQRRDLWWKFTGPTVDLYTSINGSKRVLVASAVSKHHAFAFVPANYIYSNALNVFAYDTFQHFALFQSSPHGLWALQHGSKLEDRPRYNVTDCFETFPFPSDLRGLEVIGERYHESRRELMQARGEGLTKTYNRFHDPNETADDIAELRELHRQLDTAVAAAYGWSDLAANGGAALRHDFHETKQVMRWTLHPDVRRDILDRLLALNHQRHAEEVAAGLHDKKGGKKKPAAARPQEPEFALEPAKPGEQIRKAE